ncbi:MAG: BamA/TamA family outer membrane protein [Bacteroidales bacterium]|nr:BamA/TamA family outer membrane protein [Bacteroidales bacterium]
MSSSCSPTRRIPEGEYLLDKTRVNIDSKKIDRKNIKRFERQSPNKTVLTFKFHLWLYNLASPKREKFPSSWFRKIGEQPVIWDPVLTEQTTQQYIKYLETKGYYHSVVEDTVKLKRKKAVVAHNITLNDPYIINGLKYDFEDQNLVELIYSDTANSLIRIGDNFDKDILQKERQRIEELLKNNGYLKFNKQFIFYNAEESKKPNRVDLTILIKENVEGYPDPVTKIRRHYKYKIDNTIIYPNFSRIGTSDLKSRISADTIRKDQNLIIYANGKNIKPDAVLMPNLCTPQSIYSLKNTQKTYSNYSSLEIIRIVNIQYKEQYKSIPDSMGFKSVDCQIELTPRKKQDLQYEVFGTNSSGDWGGQINLLYNNYNLLHGAEYLQIKLTAARESMRKRYNASPMFEVGVETTLTLPMFLVPFNARSFTRKFNPRTLINISYSYQDRPDYTRTIAKTSFGYKWKGNRFNSHYFIPVEFNYVRVPGGIKDDELREDIVGSPLENSFNDHTIVAMRYVFEYSNQVVEKNRDFVFIRVMPEIALTYVKGDIDVRYNKQITPDNRIVYRLFTGVGYPIRDSETLPFEKMYFSGGPFGIRAWSTRDLGPGSDTSSTSRYANSLGDIKIEANLEYRFSLFWKMEGALFIDAGNIWLFNEYPERPGAEFKWDRFIDELAVGTGLGLRFDFNFLLIRTDFGLKLRDPAILEGSKWIDRNENIKYNFREFIRNRCTFQFGIGYPF